MASRMTAYHCVVCATPASSRRLKSSEESPQKETDPQETAEKIVLDCSVVIDFISPACHPFLRLVNNSYVARVLGVVRMRTLTVPFSNGTDRNGTEM